MRKKVFTTKHLTTIDNRNTTDKKLLLSDKKCQVANFEFPLEKKRGKPADSPLEFVILYCKPKKYKLMGKGTTKKFHRREQYCRILLLSLPCQVELSFFCFDTIKLVKILHLTKL